MKEKYKIDTRENRDFLQKIRDDLFAFGHRFPSLGGSAWYLGDDGTPWKDKNRDTYVTCRMAHAYSIASLLGHEGGKELMEDAIKGLCGELKDREHGGWYEGLAADGKPLLRKQCYTHAFVILAFSSAYIAGKEGAEQLLEEALAEYDNYFWNEEEGLAFDNWNTEFTVLDDYRGLNANMHTVEAFLAASDATGKEEYRKRAGRIIDCVIGWAKGNNWRIPEHYTKEWEPDLEKNKEKPDDPFKPYGATPGHGMEWSRLIMQWALSVYQGNEEAMRPYLEAAKGLFERVMADAWSADGAPGIVYTTDWDGKPIVRDRMHWTLAEAINTAAVLYRITKEEKYAEAYAAFMEYLDEKVLDHVNGSWFHQLDENNCTKGTVWPGKPDIYHALQATLIPYYAPDVSIALAVKKNLKQ